MVDQPLSPAELALRLAVPQTAKLRSGTEVLLRAIVPGDVDLWRAMLATCSTETIRGRFRSLFGAPSREMAVRYCTVDFLRELALVAVLPVNSSEQVEAQMLGVGRLVATADHQQAEFALLVADPWQGQGLGRILLEHCLKAAGTWGVTELWSETAPDNAPMLALLKRLGFTLEYRQADEVVVARRSVLIK